MPYISKQERTMPSAKVKYLTECVITFWAIAAQEILGETSRKANVHEVLKCMDTYRLGDIVSEEFSEELRNRASLLMSGYSRMWDVSNLHVVSPRYREEAITTATYIAYGHFTTLAKARGPGEVAKVN